MAGPSQHPAKPQRILLVRLSAMGDILHTLPAYHVLRRGMPDAVIDWLIEDRFADMLTALPGVREVVAVPRRKGNAWKGVGEYAALRKKIARAGYTVAIDFQGLTKSAIWPWLARVPRRIGFGGEDGREISKLFYTEEFAVDPSLEHIVERNLALARHLAGREENRPESRPLLPVDPESAAWIDEYWEGHGLSSFPVALVIPGVSWPSKRWPAERFGAVAEWFVREHGGRCVVSWGPGDESLATRVAEGREGVLVLPPTSLSRLAAVAKRCRVCVSNDTGPLHLTAAVGTPCVGIYGPTDPKRNGPFGAPSRTVNVPVPCGPCWKSECREGHWDCLEKVTPEMVIRALEDLLAETASS